MAGAVASTAAAADLDFSSVTTGPTQAPGVWYTDRYAPAGFTGGVTYGGRTDTLEVTIAGSDFQGPGSFFNTQGRKLDLAPGTTSQNIDLFIDPSYLGTRSDARLAGFWATGFDTNDTVSAYPIIELARINQALVFRGWDNATGTFTNMGLPSGFATNTWQTLNISLDTGTDMFTYTVGNLSMTSAAFGTTELGNVILQGHNYGGGGNTQIHWSGGAVPEPATWAMMIMGFGGIGSLIRRRRSTVAFA